MHTEHHHTVVLMEVMEEVWVHMGALMEEWAPMEVAMEDTEDMEAAMEEWGEWVKYLFKIGGYGRMGMMGGP